MTPDIPLATGKTAPPKRTTSLSRLFSVFASPGATFNELSEDPHFILCWCVEIVISFIFGVTLVNRIGVYTMARTALAQSPNTQALSAAQLQTTLKVMAVGMKISFLAAPVLTIIYILIIAAIFLGLANFLLGYQANYKQSLAMVSYAFLAMTLYSIIEFIVVLASPNPTSLQFTNLVGTNIGFYLDKNTTSKFLYALGTHVDLFAIWTVILLGVGLAKLGGKKGRVGASTSVVVALWLLCILIFSGLSAL
ncbi:MAG: YIP1 family protein [Terriglobales bacterium]